MLKNFDSHVALNRNNEEDQLVDILLKNFGS